MTSEIREHIEAMHNQLEMGEFIELRAFNAKAKLKPVVAFVTSYDEAVAFTVKHMTTYNVYAGVCPRWRKGSGKSGGGRNDDVRRSYWIWADFDAKDFKLHGDILMRHVLKRIVLPPTMLVSSGRGGLHMYWAIDPTDDLERVQHINNGISDWFNIAHVGDPARILRIAGTQNHKEAEPLPVRLLHYDPTVSYALDDVNAALNANEALALMVHSGDMTAYPSRSERDFAVIGGLIHCGFSDAAITTIYDKRRIGEKYQTEGEHYLETTIAKLRSNDNVPNAFAPILAQAKGKDGNKWGIVERDNCYYKVVDNSVIQLSTFVFEPELILEGDLKQGEPDTLLGTMLTPNGNVWSGVPLTKDAFNKSDTLSRQLPKVEWQWLGKDGDVKKLLPYLLDKLRVNNNNIMPTKFATPVVGRHGDVFVSPNQTIDVNGIISADAVNTVWLPTGREYPHVQLAKHVPAVDDSVAGGVDPALVGETLNDFIDLYFKINEEHITMGVLGWYCAALIKPLLEAQDVRMPTLNLFGTRGSGKTSLLTRVMQPLIGYEHSRTYSSNTTPFVMLTLLGCSNATPVSFSEYRRSSLRDPERILHYLLMAYDNGYDSRGTQQQKTVEYPLCAPFTIDGEDAMVDPAALERMIQVNLHPETIAEDTEGYRKFQSLMSLDLSVLSLPLIQASLSFVPDFVRAIDDLRVVFPMSLPDRVRRNMAVVLVGLRLFEHFVRQYDLQMPEYDIETIFTPLFESVVNLQSGRTSLMVDEFVTDVVNFIAFNEGGDKFVYKYESETKMLYFQITSAHGWWEEKRVQQRKTRLELKALRHQLAERTVKNEEVPPHAGYYGIASHAKYFNGATTWVYGVSLPAAVETGLEIPDALSKFEPIIRTKVDRIAMP